MMSPAGGRHGWVVMNVAGPLATFVREHKLGVVLGAETGFFIERNPDTVRASDVAFVRSKRSPDPIPEEFFEGAPDIAVEVLSPLDSASEVHEKAEQWLASGCAEVWLVDPRRQVASICTRSDAALCLQAVQVLASELLPGFALSVTELFKL